MHPSSSNSCGAPASSERLRSTTKGQNRHAIDRVGGADAAEAKDMHTARKPQRRYAIASLGLALEVKQNKR